VVVEAFPVAAGDDIFMWPHPTEPGKALFAVDDAYERTTRDLTSGQVGDDRTVWAKVLDLVASLSGVATDMLGVVE